MHPSTGQRGHPRLTPTFPLFVECPETRRIRDISLAGAFVEERRPFSPGQVVQMRMWLGRVKPVVINATVRRTEEGAGMGVEFLPLKQDDLHQLKEFLHSPLVQSSRDTASQV